ncbi:T9SS type A sorting domain-containing protein [Chryseobacterium sp. MMS23-Vi53]|uniref:T9SS type A sorting domain-containing protein n=1 Tax=Chryseobacterium sp. MMS23-Vi53 TaxID=3386644 RepID=UPI0039E8DE96
MKKKSILMIFATAFSVATVHATPSDYGGKTAMNNHAGKFSPPYVYDLDPGFVLQQTANQKGLVLIEGKLTKPFMTGNVKLSVKYKDSAGNWVTGWCKTLYSYNQYNETLRASFELPASTASSYNLKIELSSDTNLSNFSGVTWDKSIKHYKQGDYAGTSCDLDENEYTILLTPKKDGTLITDSNGKVTGIKDRVTSAYSWNKIGNVQMDNKKNDVVFSPASPAALISATGANSSSKSVKMTNQGTTTSVLGSTPEFIYNVSTGHPSPYLYSYNDPVYMFAGKFSINGLMMKFSQWSGDTNGQGYHNFKNPNQLESRYFNTYNSLQKKLSEFMTDQEPIVIVSSQATGLRIYKSNGSFINLEATSNYGAAFFGYGNDQGGARRGPGSENLIISDTPEMTLYGMGALRNDATTTSQSIRSSEDINSEIAKFINYVGIFGDTKLDTGVCANSCFTLNNGALPDNNVVDWTKAPNSYIFVPNQENDGLYIPIKKAYVMWKNGSQMGGSNIPNGNISADVFWEDVPGLIKSGVNYSLEIVGTGEDAKIKVPINKSKEGNAVVALKGSDDKIYWSWHIWVTDDPRNGTKYKSFDGVTRERNDGIIEPIPDSDWGWMDRNLGALTNSITSDDWNRSGGLLYQWGRKDPQPPLVFKNDFYEVTGTVGRVRHQGFIDNTNSTTWQKINTFTKYIKLSNATVANNIRLTVNNPLGLVYINKDENNTQAYYKLSNGADNLNAPINWFGSSSLLSADRLSELNLWSDNSQGMSIINYNEDAAAAPYRNKSSYDPCPNGWRIPSLLVATLSDNIRLDFSPFGIKKNIKLNELDFIQNPNSNTGTYLYKIRPNDSNVPDYFKGFKVYSNFGIDMSNVGGNNMGIFPGTGAMLRGFHEGEYTDQHHIALWTSTMQKSGNNLPVTGAASLSMIPDKDQSDATGLANVTGRYWYNPLNGATTSDVAACRCIKDPLYKINQYDFPTEFFNEIDYSEGINNPNTYNLTKSSTALDLNIPISKAFSVQSKLLNNNEILNPANFDNLKVNVLWTDNKNLINNVKLSNSHPVSLNDLSNTNINLKINANNAGNAIITLHNGSITNPVYWSWHIWVTNTNIETVRYKTDQPITEATNYVNYIKQGRILDTEFMDRNLGAQDMMPAVSGTPNATDLAKIKLSGGMHYQWGRKDPIPSFINIGGSTYNIYLGNVDNDGNVTYPTTISSATYDTAYIVESDIYRNSANSNILSTDKISEKTAKILAYSVKNPLVFMKPSTKQPYKAGLTNGSDWLSNETNIAPDRWGRGGNKSPFDPCPQGWRIPDVTSVVLANTNYGFTPFYKKGITESYYYKMANEYQGRVFSYSGHWGYIFDNDAYKIGNYPIAGVRGLRTVIGSSTSVINSTVDRGFFRMWMAGLSNTYGRPISMGANISASNLQVFEEDNDPYFGASCRCVKIKSDGANEAGPLPRLQVTTTSTAKATNVLAKIAIEEKVVQNKLEFFPNPVKSILYIKGNDKVKDYYYQLYNMSGQLVKSGKFENEQTDLSSLISGAYLLRINNAETVVKIIKE